MIYSLWIIPYEVWQPEFHILPLFDRKSSLNDTDFWVRVSKEKAEFKENSIDTTVSFNKGVYKECISLFTIYLTHCSNQLTFLIADYFTENCKLSTAKIIWLCAVKWLSTNIFECNRYLINIFVKIKFVASKLLQLIARC